MAGGYSVTFSVVDNATKNIDAINRRVAQMRAPMDRLSRSVSRFVDVSGLQKVAQGFDWIGKAASGVLRTLTTIVPVMGAITGAATITGMMKLVQSYANWSHELVATADNIGTTTQSLQQFQDATRLAGGDAGDMTESLKGLHSTLGNINIGSGNAAGAMQWFNKLGINVRDANGHIRTTTELMPELIQKIAGMKDPLDRARAANELLGASGDKLVETFRQSSQTFSQWFSDVSRYKDLTDEQKKSLQLFTEAQGRLGVAFDRLGQQISVVVAQDFAPLMNRISEFVEKHTPEIIAAIDQISQKFVAWLEGVDWSKVEDGINKLLDGLKWVVNNLDTIKEVAEGIAVLFATKWALGMVASIGKVVTAIGTPGGGTGLLASLAAVASAATLAFNAWEKAQNPETYAPKNLAPDSPFWGVIPEEEQKKYPNSPVNQQNKPAGPSFSESPTGWLKNRLGFGGGGTTAPAGPVQRQSATGGYLPGGVTPASLGGPPGTEARQPGAVPGTEARQPGTPPPEVALPGDTSWGDYGTRANNPGNLNYAGWEGASGRFSYTDPQTGGAHTMGVFSSMPEGVAATYKLLARNQEKYGKTIAGALHGYAENSYAASLAKSLGVDQNAEYDLAKADPKQVEQMLEGQFKREGRKGTHTATPEQILQGITLARSGNTPAQVAQAGPPPAPTPALSPLAAVQAASKPDAPVAPAPTAPPVTVPPPSPVNGAVDVSITHKNPPPNSAVTASGSGSVNVAPVRVEHQDMASI